MSTLKTNFCIHQLLILLLLFGGIHFASCKKSQAVEPNIVKGPKTPLTNTDWFLSVSDVHLTHGKGNAKFGRYHNTGDSLWARTKIKIESEVALKKPKFMVYLGDLPDYDDTKRDTNIYEMLENLRKLNIDIPILYLPGNNDSPGGDYHSFRGNDQGTLKSPFDLDPNSSDPWPILHDSTGTAQVTNVDFKPDFGYYYAAIVVGSDTLHTLALNTVIFCDDSGSHSYVSDDGIAQQSAATTQMDWFVGKLDSLKKTNRIMVMMHIPPGRDGYTNSRGHNGYMWESSLSYTYKGQQSSVQNAFLRIVADHPQIVGLLSGHTHLDGLRRLNAKNQQGNLQLAELCISTPGITIGHGNNPGFKFFKYQQKTFELLDFETIYAVPTQKSYYYRDSTKNDSLFVYQGASYTFKQTYGGTNPSASATMYSIISNSQTSDIINDMQEIIEVESNQGYGNFNFGLALDVNEQ